MSSESFLHQLVEIYFTIIPVPFFVQMLDLIAAVANFLFGIIGIESNIVGF